MQVAERTRAGLLAVLGAAAFTVIWAVLGFVSDGYRMWDITVDSYSWIAQPISGLGLGSTAPVMNAAFVVCGILISVGTWSAARRSPRSCGQASSSRRSRTRSACCGRRSSTS